jgi:hypothetical protein
MVKSSLQVAIENLVNQIAIEISYISNSTIFYVYSLTSKKYRQEVFHLLSLVFKRRRGINTNIVQPFEGTGSNANETMAKVNMELYRSNIHNRVE